MTPGSQGTYLKTDRVITNPRRVFTLSQAVVEGVMMTMVLMMRSEPLCRHGTMYSVTATQHRALKNLSSGLSIFSSPLISVVRCGGQEIDGGCNAYRRSQLGSQLPARPPYSETGFIVIII
jgi:hypothetical protein